MRTIRVTYDGYAGHGHGAAIVLARSVNEAIELVRKDDRTENFVGVATTDLGRTVPSVVWNWGGDPERLKASGR